MRKRCSFFCVCIHYKGIQYHCVSTERTTCSLTSFYFVHILFHAQVILHQKSQLIYISKLYRIDPTDVQYWWCILLWIHVGRVKDCDEFIAIELGLQFWTSFQSKRGMISKSFELRQFLCEWTGRPNIYVPIKCKIIFLRSYFCGENRVLFFILNKLNLFLRRSRLEG